MGYLSLQKFNAVSFIYGTRMLNILKTKGKSCICVENIVNWFKL